jgi:hypothetical protein
MRKDTLNSGERGRGFARKRAMETAGRIIPESRRTRACVRGLRGNSGADRAWRMGVQSAWLREDPARFCRCPPGRTTGMTEGMVLGSGPFLVQSEYVPVVRPVGVCAVGWERRSRAGMDGINNPAGRRTALSGTGVWSGASGAKRGAPGFFDLGWKLGLLTGAGGGDGFSGGWP